MSVYMVVQPWKSWLTHGWWLVGSCYAAWGVLKIFADTVPLDGTFKEPSTIS